MELNNNLFSIEKKKRMVAKISLIKDKEKLKKIKDIIIEENPNIKINKVNGGILMFFDNCNKLTYIRIDKYLNELHQDKINEKKNNKKKINNEVIIDEIDYFKNRTRLKYSNKEKRLIKKKTYDKILSKKSDKIHYEE